MRTTRSAPAPSGERAFLAASGWFPCSRMGTHLQFDVGPPAEQSATCCAPAAPLSGPSPVWVNPWTVSARLLQLTGRSLRLRWNTHARFQAVSTLNRPLGGVHPVAPFLLPHPVPCMRACALSPVRHAVRLVLLLRVSCAVHRGSDGKALA